MTRQILTMQNKQTNPRDGSVVPHRKVRTNNKNKQIIPSFKEVMEDEIIVNELKSLYLGITNTTDSDGSIDDWECILADRMGAIINDDLETFEKRWITPNGKYCMFEGRVGILDDSS